MLLKKFHTVSIVMLLKLNDYLMYWISNLPKRNIWLVMNLLLLILLGILGCVALIPATVPGNI